MGDTTWYQQNRARTRAAQETGTPQNPFTGIPGGTATATNDLNAMRRAYGLDSIDEFSMDSLRDTVVAGVTQYYEDRANRRSSYAGEDTLPMTEVTARTAAQSKAPDEPLTDEFEISVLMRGVRDLILDLGYDAGNYELATTTNFDMEMSPTHLRPDRIADIIVTETFGGL